MRAVRLGYKGATVGAPLVKLEMERPAQSLPMSMAVGEWGSRMELPTVKPGWVDS